ncbi:MAG: hypothetical protein ACI4RV_09110, partial [Eubacteriales bacterium]
LGNNDAKTRAFLDKAARLYHEALSESAGEGDGKKGVSYSISEIQGEKENYGKGVILDTNIFDKVSVRNWGRVLKEFVYEHLAGKEFTVFDANGKAEKVYLAKINERVTKDGATHNHKVIDKLARYKGNNIRALATVHLPETLTTSDYEKTIDENSHQWMDKDGWEYRKVYLQDKKGNIYEATLNIANSGSRKILYDINRITQIDTKKETSGGVVASVVSENRNDGLAQHHKVSDNMISEKSDVVNTFSEKSIKKFSVSKANADALSVRDSKANENDAGVWDEYQKTMQEEYDKRRVLDVSEGGKSVSRGDLSKTDAAYLERAERKMLNRIASSLGVPYRAKHDFLADTVIALSDEFLKTGNISQGTVDKVFETAYENGIEADMEFYDRYKEVKSYFRTKAIAVSDDIKRDFPDWNTFRQSTMGTMRLVNEGNYSVSDAYTELADTAPELVNKNIINDADMLRDLFEVLHSIQKAERKLSDVYNEDDKALAKMDFTEAVYSQVRELRTVRNRANDRMKSEMQAREKSDLEKQSFTAFKEMTENDRKAVADMMLKADAQMKDAKSNMQRVERKHLLTQEEEGFVWRLLKREITFDFIDAEKYNIPNIRAVYEAREGYEAAASVLNEYKRKHKEMLIDDARRVLWNMYDTHDKIGINYATETAERNVR